MSVSVTPVPVPASPLALLLWLVLEGAAQGRMKDRHSWGQDRDSSHVKAFLGLTTGLE